MGDIGEKLQFVVVQFLRFLSVDFENFHLLLHLHPVPAYFQDDSRDENHDDGIYALCPPARPRGRIHAYLYDFGDSPLPVWFRCLDEETVFAGLQVVVIGVAVACVGGNPILVIALKHIGIPGGTGMSEIDFGKLYGEVVLRMFEHKITASVYGVSAYVLFVGGR